MSKLWENFPKDSNHEGIISLINTYDFNDNIDIDESLKIKINTNNEINQDVLLFIIQNGLSSSGNSYILNPKTVINNVNIQIINKITKEILGFVLSIPNTIKLNGVNIESGLTTNRCVSLQHRNKKLGEFLILGVINYGKINKIFTGYHYISEPKTPSAIEVLNFFRPLNVDLCKQCGYIFPEKDYILNDFSDYTIKESIYENFSSLIEQSSKLNRILISNITKEEYNKHFNNFEFLSVLNKGKLIGVCIYKTVLLKIGKVNKICPVARLVFMECFEKHTQQVMTKIINYLVERKKHIVLSGVCFGNLTDESIRNKLGFSLSGKSYLDFYNLHINKENCLANKVNLLYL